jgi:hypothetical protein
MSDHRMLDVTDAEQIGPNEYQPLPLRFQTKSVAMKWGRAVADVKDKLEAGAITTQEAERLWAKITWQCRDEDTRRTTGIVVVRNR